MRDPKHIDATIAELEKAHEFVVKMEGLKNEQGGPSVQAPKTKALKV